jgi:hypothetical protein
VVPRPVPQTRATLVSAGQPTALVRDSGVEGQDPTTAGWEGTPEEPAEVPAVDETLRAGVDSEHEDPDEAGHYG